MKTTHSAELPKAPGAAISESPSNQSAEGANPIPQPDRADVGNRETGAQPSPTSFSSSSSPSKTTPPTGDSAPPLPTSDIPPPNSNPAHAPHPNSETSGPAPHQSTNPSFQQSAKPGRPSKLTPALITSICHKICEFGLSDSAAAAHCGIPASTLSRWKFLNPELELRFVSAREDFRIRHIHEIQHAATKDGRRDWRAAAWLLERIFPEDYARRPGRRVNPASENQTWLDQARAQNTASEHRFYQHEIERAFQWRGDQARDFMSDPDWDRKEGNIGCLPTEEYLIPTDDPDPAVLPKSYATYAEATEESLRQAKASRLPTPAPEPPETPDPTENRLPLPHHLHLPQETAPLSTTHETPQTTSKITGTLPPPLKTTAPDPFQNYRNSHPAPKILTSQIPASIHS